MNQVGALKVFPQLYSHLTSPLAIRSSRYPSCWPVFQLCSPSFVVQFSIATCRRISYFLGMRHHKCLNLILNFWVPRNCVEWIFRMRMMDYVKSVVSFYFQHFLHLFHISRRHLLPTIILDVFLIKFFGHAFFLLPENAENARLTERPFTKHFSSPSKFQKQQFCFYHQSWKFSHVFIHYKLDHLQWKIHEKSVIY